MYKNKNSYYCIFYGNPKLSTGFDYKGKTSLTISQSTNFEIGEITRGSLNAEVDFSGFRVPAKIGGTVERTRSESWGTASKSERTISAKAPKGYYSLNVCVNFKKIKLKRYEGESYVDSIRFDAPTGQPYRSLIYNPKSPSYDKNARKY